MTDPALIPADAAGHLCSTCGRTFPTATGLKIHRSHLHEAKTPTGPSRWSALAPRPIEGVPPEVAMTCWCGRCTFLVPRSWVGHSAPSCDPDCYRRSGAATDHARTTRRTG